MEKQEIKKLLIARRMEAKLKLERFKYLSESSNLSFNNEIDKVLDLISTIDKALEELK